MMQLALKLGYKHCKPIIPLQGLERQYLVKIHDHATHFKLCCINSQCSCKIVCYEISTIKCETLEFSAKTFQHRPLIMYMQAVYY